MQSNIFHNTRLNQEAIEETLKIQIQKKKTFFREVSGFSQN